MVMESRDARASVGRISRPYTAYSVCNTRQITLLLGVSTGSAEGDAYGTEHIFVGCLIEDFGHSL